MPCQSRSILHNTLSWVLTRGRYSEYSRSSRYRSLRSDSDALGGSSACHRSRSSRRPIAWYPLGLPATSASGPALAAPTSPPGPGLIPCHIGTKSSAVLADEAKTNRDQTMRVLKSPELVPGSPLSHLRREWAQPPPHLHQDLGSPPPTSAPGLGSPVHARQDEGFVAQSGLQYLPTVL